MILRVKSTEHLLFEKVPMIQCKMIENARTKIEQHAPLALLVDLEQRTCTMYRRVPYILALV